MKRNLTGRVIPAALALALAAAPVNAFAATKAVQATGVADENGFISQPGNEYDDATMKKLADNMLEYDEIGKLVEVYSPTFKTLKETYSDKKDASKDVAKLKSQLSDKSASILDAADQTVQSAEAAPNVSSWSLKNLDSQIKFGELPEGAYTYMVFLTDSNGQTICFMSDFTVSSAATSTATYWTVQDPSGSKLGENVQKAVESVSETASAVEQSAWSWLGNLFGE